MGSILKRLWGDADYFNKTVAFLIATLAVLPLGEFGPIGIFVNKIAFPLAVAIGATSKGSGLTADEAAKLRALIPAQDKLDKLAPKI